MKTEKCPCLVRCSIRKWDQIRASNCYVINITEITPFFWARNCKNRIKWQISNFLAVLELSNIKFTFYRMGHNLKKTKQKTIRWFFNDFRFIQNDSKMVKMSQNIYTMAQILYKNDLTLSRITPSLVNVTQSSPKETQNFSKVLKSEE